jgi:hypothetical protein
MTTRPNGGTPLHEAVFQKHEAMVELLLQHSANPFAENLHSRTAMDLAVSSGNVAIIRLLERKAIFAGGACTALRQHRVPGVPLAGACRGSACARHPAPPWPRPGHTLGHAQTHTPSPPPPLPLPLLPGYINFKVLTYNGFANSWKDRHCVVMPRYEAPAPQKHQPAGPGPGGSAPGSPASTPAVVVRKQLWLYKDLAAAAPRTRVWLDGASAYVTGGGAQDGVVQLHQSHEEPAKM